MFNLLYFARPVDTHHINLYSWEDACLLQNLPMKEEGFLATDQNLNRKGP